ncbi:MAG: hypothetical protein GXP25_08520 [Planctomycetes bacterium]|nr:hypothetical protein [Planctomycetota bacterium]
MSDNALGFLNSLAAVGVVLTRADDQLRFDAPKGVMTPKLRAQIKAYKAALLDALKSPDLPPDLLYLWEERMTICLIDGGIGYGEALQAAWKQIDGMCKDQRSGAVGGVLPSVPTATA